MNRADAHAFLNAAIGGAPATPGQITAALRATGDLDGWSVPRAEPERQVASKAWPYYATETGEQPGQQ